MTIRLPRPRFSTRSYCLLAVSLLHGALLFAVLQAGGADLPATATPPQAVTIALIPPAAPAVSVPAAEPAPQPVPPSPQPEPIPKPVSKPLAATRPEPASVPQTVPATAAPATPATPSPNSEPHVASESVTRESDANQNAVSSEPIFDADYLRNPAPVYPKLSRQRKEEGVVLLRVHVLANGEADQLEVLQSSGFERLDEAALRAVRRWQFVPAKRGDKTVAAWVRVPVRFNVNS